MTVLNFLQLAQAPLLGLVVCGMGAHFIYSARMFRALSSEIKEVRREIEEVRRDLSLEIKEVRGEIDKVRDDLSLEIKSVRNEVHELCADMEEGFHEIISHERFIDGILVKQGVLSEETCDALWVGVDYDSHDEQKAAA